MKRGAVSPKLSTLPFALGLVSAMLFALCVPAEAQQPKKTYRIGYLSPRPGFDSASEAFRQGLSELGYIERRNIVIEWRFAKGKSDLFSELAAELVRLRLGCIVAIGVGAIRAVKQLTTRSRL